MIFSPLKEAWLNESQCLSRASFFFSFSIKCAAAVADLFSDTVFISEGKRWPLGGVIVQSKPTLVNGMCGIVVCLRFKTGRKEESNGQRPGRSAAVFLGLM